MAVFMLGYSIQVQVHQCCCLFFFYGGGDNISSSIPPMLQWTTSQRLSHESPVPCHCFPLHASQAAPAVIGQKTRDLSSPRSFLLFSISAKDDSASLFLAAIWCIASIIKRQSGGSYLVSNKHHTTTRSQNQEYLLLFSLSSC